MRIPHWFDDFLIGCFCLTAVYLLFRWSAGLRARHRLGARTLLLFAGACIAAGIGFSIVRISNLFPHLVVIWGRALAIVIGAWALSAFAIIALWRAAPRFDPKRRSVLTTIRNSAFVAPPVLTGFAFLRRYELAVREIDIIIPNLHKDLHGTRILQLSDIHLSPFLSEKELAQAIGIGNELRPHLAVVTGDLITRRGDPLDACLKQLAGIRAEAGILGCMGNHEIYAVSESYTADNAAKLGMHFLRHECRTFDFGSARLSIAGVDYQRKGSDYLEGAERLIVPAATNILLSHNPDVFPVAARQGYDLTIAGHTHGGQVNFEILDQNVNIARFFTPYVYGLYRQGNQQAWVTRGIGTVGIPARLGAPAEIALLRLCATSS